MAVSRERVCERVAELIAERRSALPAEFEVCAFHAGMHDGAIVVALTTSHVAGGEHHCEGVFQEVCDRVNADFKNDRGFKGIELDVPYEYLGEVGRDFSIAEYETCTRSRLQRGRNG